MSVEKNWWVEVHEDYTNVESEFETIACDVGNEHANLIATAPKLYKALKELSDWCVFNLTFEQFEEAKELGFAAELAMREARGD